MGGTGPLLFFCVFNLYIWSLNLNILGFDIMEREDMYAAIMKIVNRTLAKKCYNLFFIT